MPDPWKYGFADGVMGRPSESPWKDFPRQAKYTKGYLAATNYKFKKGTKPNDLHIK